MQYKMIATDMDGTALTDDKRLTKRTVTAMQKAIEQGKQIVISTGRSVSLIKPYLDAVKGVRYVLTSCGGTVIDLETGEYLLHRMIDTETVTRIIAAANGHFVCPIIFYEGVTCGSEWCVNMLGDFGLPAYEPIYRQYMNIVDDAMNHYMENPQPLEKFNLFFTDPHEAAEVYEKIKDLPVTFTARTARSMEINAVGVSKAEGLKTLCKHLGIQMSEVIAVGDSENDEEMLACAGLKVAMANGSDKVKAIADVIADSNENDGVAKLIEQYLLD